MADLFDYEIINQPGWVSSRLRFQDNSGTRYLLVNEQVIYTYDLDDRFAARHVWVQAFQSNFANQAQIAKATGIGYRTIHGWVKNYRTQGLAGLVDSPRSGRPPKTDQTKQRLILQYRENGNTILEIARKTNLSVSTINRVLGRLGKPENLELALNPSQQKDVQQETPSQCPQAPEVPVKAPEVDSPVEPPAQSPIVLDNPLDRSLDRMSAMLGLLEDAKPIFAAGSNLPWVGAFMAIALLSSDPLLPTAKKVFGKVLGSAFYGLRTVMVTVVMMALLRIKRPENLREHEACGLGRVLGLDRICEVKTLRRKFHLLSGQNKANTFLEQLGKARVKDLEQSPEVLYIDGHVCVYTGKSLIGQIHAARKKCVTKGTTQNWVNLPGQQPLFFLTSEFNEGLVSALPAVIKKAKEVCEVKHFTLVFDRGGFCGELFEMLLDQGHNIITYRRGKSDDWPIERFELTETTIGKKTYPRAPAQELVELPIYKEVTAKSGVLRRQKTGRTITMKEIRVLREDGGQTVVLTSPKNNEKLTEVCDTLFKRWGAQENIFKYLLSEFALDATTEYGDVALSEDITHPNPVYIKVQKQIKKLKTQVGKLLAKLKMPLAGKEEEQPKIRKKLKKWQKSKTGLKAQELSETIEKLQEKLHTMTPRCPAHESGLRRLKSENRTITTTLKLTAYHIETKLLEMIRPYYKQHAKEGRKVVASALRSHGSIRLEPGKIIISLDKQSSPSRTKAIGKLCARLNEFEAIYPGTNLRIVFENRF